ncbi:MAG: efflux RND transporter periplasmic adaptor subunit [Bacteroidales bacterium]|jgi:HlyD family secretion protein|nr:efflux RND transporter periplasmic adaptor subunit [Bacteroidales bacterium]
MDKKIIRKSTIVNKIVILSISAIVISFVVFNLITTNSNTLNVNKDQITISSVNADSFQEYISLNGTIIPKETRTIVATEGGRLENIFIKTGSIVQKGDKILQLSNTNLLMEIMDREAELYRQSNNLRETRLAFENHSIELDQQLLDINFNLVEAQSTYENNKCLSKNNIISKQEYDTSFNTYNYYNEKIKLTQKSKEKDLEFRSNQIEQLEVTLERMENNLKIVKSMQDELTVKAPFTGLISLVDLKLGESYSPGARLGQIDIQNSFKVRGDISEHYISRVDVGKRGSFKYSDEKFPLELAMIYPEVVEGEFKVDFDFKDKIPEGIRRGQSFSIDFELSDLSEAILVPRGSFYNTTGGYWIFVVDKSGNKAYKRNIKIGRNNPLFYEILEGLEPGEKVITSSYDNFGDAEELIIN